MNKLNLNQRLIVGGAVGVGFILGLTLMGTVALWVSGTYYGPWPFMVTVFASGILLSCLGYVGNPTGLMAWDILYLVITWGGQFFMLMLNINTPQEVMNWASFVYGYAIFQILAHMALVFFKWIGPFNLQELTPEKTK